MTLCPACGFENIQGVDVCEQCQSPLSRETERGASSDVEQRILADRISVLSPREPILVEADTKVGDVLRTMVDRGVGSTIVVRGDNIVGIFSERDALFRLGTTVSDHFDDPISDFMTPDPQVLEGDDRIAFALSKMDLGGYRHLPVVENGICTGVVSVRDVLRYLSETILATPSK